MGISQLATGGYILTSSFPTVESVDSVSQLSAPEAVEGRDGFANGPVIANYANYEWFHGDQL